MGSQKLYVDFWLCGGISAPNPRVIQGSTVFYIRVYRLNICLNIEPKFTIAIVNCTLTELAMCHIELSTLHKCVNVEDHI